MSRWQACILSEREFTYADSASDLFVGTIELGSRGELVSRCNSDTETEREKLTSNPRRVLMSCTLTADYGASGISAQALSDLKVHETLTLRGPIQAIPASQAGTLNEMLPLMLVKNVSTCFRLDNTQ